MQALHEALMRQEELLAYIDRQQEAKFRVSANYFIYNGSYHTLIHLDIVWLITIYFWYDCSEEEAMLLKKACELIPAAIFRFTIHKFTMRKGKDSAVWMRGGKTIANPNWHFCFFGSSEIKMNTVTFEFSAVSGVAGWPPGYFQLCILLHSGLILLCTVLWCYLCRICALLGNANCVLQIWYCKS